MLIPVKLDENMPRRVEAILRAHGHDVDTIHHEGQAGQPDSTVAEAAMRAGSVSAVLIEGNIAVMESH